MSFIFKSSSTQVNGIDRTKSAFPITVKTKKGTVLKVSYINRQFKLDAKACDMVVTYKDTKIEAYISSSIGDKVEGMCGTCNSNKGDDLIPRGGKASTSARLFAESWSVPDNSGLQPQP